MVRFSGGPGSHICTVLGFLACFSDGAQVAMSRLKLLVSSLIMMSQEFLVFRCNHSFCFIASRICHSRMHNYSTQQKKQRIAPSNSLFIFTVNKGFTLFAFKL